MGSVKSGVGGYLLIIRLVRHGSLKSGVVTL